MSGNTITPAELASEIRQATAKLNSLLKTAYREKISVVIEEESTYQGPEFRVKSIQQRL